MRTVTWIDPKGRKFARKIDDGDSDEEAQYGIPIGPPDIVDTLGLPEEIATELHNQLFERKMFRMDDVRKRPREVFAALQAALQISQQKIMAAYNEYEKETVS